MYKVFFPSRFKTGTSAFEQRGLTIKNLDFLSGNTKMNLVIVKPFKEKLVLLHRHNHYISLPARFFKFLPSLLINNLFLDKETFHQGKTYYCNETEIESNEIEV